MAFIFSEIEKDPTGYTSFVAPVTAKTRLVNTSTNQRISVVPMSEFEAMNQLPESTKQAVIQSVYGLEPKGNIVLKAGTYMIISNGFSSIVSIIETTN